MIDVVAHDIFEQAQNPMVKMVSDENDEKVLQIVVGGAVVYLWPAVAMLERMLELVEE